MIANPHSPKHPLSVSSQEEQLLAEILSISQPGNFCMLSASVLLIYAHALTFAQERQFIWSGRKFTGVTVLFLLNKLCGIGFAICTVLSLPGINWSTARFCSIHGALCSTGTDTRYTNSTNAIADALSVFLHLLKAIYLGFTCLRVYAIGGRTWRYAALVLFLGSVSFAMNVFITISVERLPTDSVSALLAAWLPFLSTFKIAVIISFVFVIVTDVVVLFVTWTSTYKVKRDAHLVNMKAPLATLLLRDGTVYFVFFLLLHIAIIASYFLMISIFISVAYFGSAFTSITMSSFILNLREVYLLDTNADYATPSFVVSQASDLRFASPIVGNMGAPLSLSTMSHIDGVRDSLRELLGSEGEDGHAGVDEDELDELGIEEVPRISRNPMAVDFDPEEY